MPPEPHPRYVGKPEILEEMQSLNHKNANHILMLHHINLSFTLIIILWFPVYQNNMRQALLMYL